MSARRASSHVASLMSRLASRARRTEPNARGSRPCSIASSMWDWNSSSSSRFTRAVRKTFKIRDHMSISPQHFGRVDANGADHRWQRGEERGGEDGYRRQRQHREIRRLHPVEKSLEIGLRKHASGETRARSNQDHGEDLDSDAPRYVDALGTEGHADANLAAPLLDAEVEYTEQAHGGKQQRHNGEEERQHGEKALTDG